MSLCGGHVLASAEWVTRPSSPENLNGYELHLETLPHLTSRVMKRKVQVPCSNAFLLLQLPTLGGWSHPFSGCANHSVVLRKGKLSQLDWEDQKDTAMPGGLLFSGPLTKTLIHIQGDHLASQAQLHPVSSSPVSAIAPKIHILSPLFPSWPHDSYFTTLASLRLLSS